VKNTKTIGKSYVHEVLKRVEKYPEEEDEKVKPKEFLRPKAPGECFCIDTGACFIGDKTQIHFQPVFNEFNSELVVLAVGMSCDHTRSLKALEELCCLYLDKALAIRSDGGAEFNNNDVNDFILKKGISGIKVSKPRNNPFAERGFLTIKHE
jgi:hypothetical protein